MRNSSANASMAATTASADNVAAFRNGDATPTADAPSASALAASMPVRSRRWQSRACSVRRVAPFPASLRSGCPSRRRPGRVDAALRSGPDNSRQRSRKCHPRRRHRWPPPRHRPGGPALPLIPQPTSFTTTGTPRARQTLSILTEQPPPVPIAIRLERLLQRVDVQNEGIGADHVDRPPAVIHAVAPVKLHCAKVGKQQNIRRNVAHPEGVGRFGLLEAGTLRTQSHRDAARLRALGQGTVNRCSGSRAAGHRRNHERQSQGLAKQLDAGADGPQIEFRQTPGVAGGNARTRWLLWETGPLLRDLFEYDPPCGDRGP